MNVMVCVTSQKSCDRLIQRGKEIADQHKGDLLIVHIAHYEFAAIGKTEEGEALEYLYEKALECGANLTVVRSNNILGTLVDMCQRNKVDKIVLGESREYNSHNVVERLTNDLAHTNVEIVAL